MLIEDANYQTPLTRFAAIHPDAVLHIRLNLSQWLYVLNLYSKFGMTHEYMSLSEALAQNVLGENEYTIQTQAASVEHVAVILNNLQMEHLKRAISTIDELHKNEELHFASKFSMLWEEIMIQAVSQIPPAPIKIYRQRTK